MRQNIRIARLDKEPFSVKFDASEKKIVTLNKKSARHSTYKWEEIVKTGKTGKFLFLYVNKTQSVVLEKEKMQPGDDAQILKWIAEAKQAQKVAKERLKNSKK